MESIEMVGFANGATARLSEINLNEITTENTFHMEEYYRLESVESGTRYAKRVKWNLTLSDFMGIGWMEDGEGMPTLENVETVGIFAQLFRLDYKNMAPEDKDLNEYLNDFLTDAEFFHRDYHPLRDFLSVIADVTIILPLIESIIGYDFITGEDLTDFECGVKGVGALIDLATLGSGSLLTGLAEKGGWKLVAKAVMKEMAVDALASGTAYLTGEMMEELGLPPGASLILTAIVSETVTYVAGEYIFKDAAGNVIEKCTGDELDRILKGEIDNITPEISAVKSSKIGELIEDSVDALDGVGKGGPGSYTYDPFTHANFKKNDIKMVNDVANKVGVDRKDFGNYIHEVKQALCMRANQNFTYQELLELAEEYKNIIK